MTPRQQKVVLAAVLSGATWGAACIRAGIPLEQLHDTVEQAQQGRCRIKLRFVTRLREAGKQATEASLQQHRKGEIHA